MLLLLFFSFSLNIWIGKRKWFIIILSLVKDCATQMFVGKTKVFLVGRWVWRCVLIKVFSCHSKKVLFFIMSTKKVEIKSYFIFLNDATSDCADNAGCGCDVTRSSLTNTAVTAVLSDTGKIPCFKVTRSKDRILVGEMSLATVSPSLLTFIYWLWWLFSLSFQHFMSF